MEIDLPFVWAGLIAFAVLAYVILDGFDLGLGILFPFLPDHESRDQAMNSVAPVWDGNETWLVLGGGGLMAVFPLAYAVVLPALYAPIVAMLLGLIFRGVAFEYRWRANRRRWVWDAAFFAGSFGATFAQGVALGALVQGIEVEGRAYAGGNWDWLTPFSLLTGLALVVGYVLLGATWLVLKTEGHLRDVARPLAERALLVTLALIGLVSLMTPAPNPDYWARWFGGPTRFFAFLVPVLVLACAVVVWRGLRQGRDGWPFPAAIAIFALCFAGIGISFYPHIVPPALTIAEAAAPESSLRFLLVGAIVLIPLILAYTAYAYWVFRGKMRAGEGYH